MVHKHARGSASQYFVASELCRRGFIATVTMGNCPNTDVLCSDIAGARFVHIQVKTFRPGDRTCTVGVKAERNYGSKFFWVLVGLPVAVDEPVSEVYVIPARVMSKNIVESHQIWLRTPGKDGKKHKDNPVRNVVLPPLKARNGWSTKKYHCKWDLIAKKLGIQQGTQSN